MHHDDEQVGQLLSRREVLALLGAAGASVLSGGPALAASAEGPLLLPSCIVRPRQTEGPYFVDEMLDRSDIRPDPTDGSRAEGVPLDLAFQVSRIDRTGCRPLSGALVDVWQCDALGVYSGVRDIGGLFDTVGKQFLRGHQTTDSDGIARFKTIYPGWYEGRTVHIHFKVRTDPMSEAGHEFTSQLYFDDAVTDRVMRRAPYSARKGAERVRNEGDGIFRNGGDQLLLAVAENETGYSGTFDIGLQIG